MADEDIVCNACGHHIESFGERMNHYKTEWHRYNVKRRCAGLDPVTEDAFQLKLSALRTEQRTVSLACDVCNKTFNTQKACDQHFISNKHKKQAAKSRSGIVRQDEDQQTETKNTSTENFPAQAESPLYAEDGKSNECSMEQLPEGPQPSGIPLKHCLFCSTSFDCVQSSLEHMLKQHGFFIPFADLMHDLQGLLLYLGEKIGIGHVCLYCNGRGRAAYPSVHAVQQHMEAKSHCKIRFEDDDDDDEFLEFYSFPTTSVPSSEPLSGRGDDNGDDQDRSDLGAPMTSAFSSSASVTPLGELVLGNGIRIGHRSLKRYYKQNLNPNPAVSNSLSVHARIQGEQDLRRSTASTAVMISMTGQYMALSLPGYALDVQQNQLQRSKFLARAAKRYMQVGVNANQLQHHFRKQIRM